MNNQFLLDKIRNTRIINNIKQSDISTMLGISQNHYSEIERGKHRITVEMLEKIGRALGIDYRELLPPSVEGQ